VEIGAMRLELFLVGGHRVVTLHKGIDVVAFDVVAAIRHCNRKFREPGEAAGDARGKLPVNSDVGERIEDHGEIISSPRWWRRTARSPTATIADDACTATRASGMRQAAMSSIRRRAAVGSQPRRTSQSDMAPPPGPPTSAARNGIQPKSPIIAREKPRAVWR